MTASLELVAVGNDVGRARAAARSLGCTLLVDERAEASDLPFRAMVTAITDDPEALGEAAGIGAYVVCRRTIKPRSAVAASGGRLPGVIGLFPMVRHPDLTHRQADRHWRDVHAPLALEHHRAMSHYRQLSVVHRLRGPEWDGFALCGFDSLEDLEERFFATPEGRVAIREDVARFADVQRSPRRVIVVEECYAR